MAVDSIIRELRFVWVHAHHLVERIVRFKTAGHLLNVRVIIS